MATDTNDIQQTSANDSNMTFDQLADRIVLVEETLRQQAAYAVNCMLTARNWFIGCYIVEFEQHGSERAQYGEQLLKKLAKRINRKGMDWRSLYNFRNFYTTYPQLNTTSVRHSPKTRLPFSGTCSKTQARRSNLSTSVPVTRSP